MVFLAEKLLLKGSKAEAILELAICAFWGMAQLGELTSPNAKGELDPRTSFLTKDVNWEKKDGEHAAILVLRDAKTC